MKEIESQHEQQIVTFNSDELSKSSKIFNCSNPTRYQQSVNDAAFELCKVDPYLILKKGRLFEQVRKNIDSAGYDYVKKVSRSTYCLRLCKQTIKTKIQKFVQPESKTYRNKSLALEKPLSY